MVVNLSVGHVEALAFIGSILVEGERLADVELVYIVGG